jgi:aspartyl-tRNA(Asn)/glutamyl-tRNA(Gln) amidotransferase subunit A
VPAAYCGLVGFKPTAARIPRDGAIPLAASLDSSGPLARSVSDCALVDAVLAGEDVQPLEALPLAELRLGIPTTIVLDDLEPDVAEAFARVVLRLSQAGATIVEFAFPELAEVNELGIAHQFTLMEGYAWHRELLAAKRELYDPIVALRLLDGAGFSAADYLALLATRQRLIASAQRTTAPYDAVIMPTLPITARRIAELEADRDLYLATGRATIRNPNSANVLDRCALTIPCHDQGRAPVGFSLMGERGADRRILAIGLSVEALLSDGKR